MILAVEYRWNPVPQGQPSFFHKNQTTSISIYAIAGDITPWAGELKTGLKTQKFEVPVVRGPIV